MASFYTSGHTFIKTTLQGYTQHESTEGDPPNLHNPAIQKTKGKPQNVNTDKTDNTTPEEQAKQNSPRKGGRGGEGVPKR